jgi:uncharacterized membrane protein YdbT with pleckstrin-like domain
MHWVVYIAPLVACVLGILAFAIALSSADGAAVGACGIFLFLIGLFRLLWVWLVRRTTELAVTNQKVLGKWGVLSRRTIEQRLEKVDSVQVDQSVLGRLLNYGTIRIHGSGSSTTPISTISNPIAFRRHVDDAVDAITSKAKIA